jgi:hypothetical protein
MHNEALETTTEEIEFVQNIEEVQALAAEEKALVEYLPKSKGKKLDTLIPRNMAFEIQKGLNDVVRVHGNIDNYVRDHLKYATVEDLWKGLAAEQVDALGLYLHMFDREQGIIIADQTGIGKGRQAAAVMRHAIVHGYLPVFFTRSPELFTDLYRDLKNIGFTDIHPFIINTESDARIKDSDGHVQFSPLSSERQYDLLVIEKIVATDSMESLKWHKRVGKPLPDPEKFPTVKLTEPIDYVPGEYNCIFCTYSQIQAASPYKKMWIEMLAERGVDGSKKYKRLVFILDESHMAGGFNSIIGRWMRRVLEKVKSCCYLSGTFAKYPEVMPFYAKKTAISETNLSDGQLVVSMERGGLALQEIVASNLAEAGQLIRRQRSNEGISFNYIVLDEEPERSKNRERVNRMIRLMNEVVSFEAEYITPILDSIHGQARRAGEHLEKRPTGLGVLQSPYFSRVFNIIDQMLFTLKVEAVASLAIRLLNENKKVVISFKSTMGSFLKDLNLQSGDILAPEHQDFAITLIKGLDSTFRYNYTDIDSAKSQRKIELEELPESGQKRYKEIKQLMMEESTGLSISPIDQLIHILQNTPKSKSLGGHKATHFKVAEITGRNQRIRYAEGEAIIESFRTDVEKFVRLFNAGDYDVLLLNAAGSTGVSAHASADFKDQRQRDMIIHQFELDINIEVQKWGRINRTGQVALPGFHYMSSDIPAEKRLMTMLKGKLKSLDANTTGSQKTSEDRFQSADFMNKYGDAVAWRWVEENPELTERMGNPTYHKGWDGILRRNESKEGAIRQITGRAGLLTVEEQDLLYNDLLARYDAHIEWEKQRGTYDLEIEFLKLDADVKKKYRFQIGTGGTSPFGRDTIREETIVNNLKRPLTKDQLDKIVAEALGGRKPQQVHLELVRNVEDKYPPMMEERKAKRMETIIKLRQELKELPDQGGGKDQEENDKIDRQYERLQEMIKEKTESLNRYMAELEGVKTTIIEWMQRWKIGQVVKVPIAGTVSTTNPYYGMFIGISFNSGNNPYTLGNVYLKFAVADSRRIVEYNLSGEQRPYLSSVYTESLTLQEEEILNVAANWNDLVKASSHKREKRHILTRNIILAGNYIGMYNKLVKYNAMDGTIKNGILLQRDFGKEGEDKMVWSNISNAYETIKELPIGEEFTDHQARIRFKRSSTNYYQVFIKKKGNFELHTEHSLRMLIERSEGQTEDDLPDFIQNAGEMTAMLHINNLEGFLNLLDNFGIKYLVETREMEDWEIENESEWEKNKTERKITSRYKLSRPYGQGSNPTIGFVSYEEPAPGSPFGIVSYDRKLSDKEKYNYSLKPIFANVEEPYKAWKEFIETTALKKEFIEDVRQASSQPFHKAVALLGNFIKSNPHEDGNPEFVFGDYSVEALGIAAYESEIGVPSAIDKLIAQLAIELEQL